MSRLRGVTRWRVAAGLTAAVAMLSVLTGVAAVAVGPSFSVGPVASLVPDGVRRAVSLSGAFTGFTLLAGAWGLRRRLRVAWYLTVLLLPVTALQGLAQSSGLSLPLVVLSLAALAVVAASRRSFDRRLDLPQSQLTALATLVGVFVYGTAGTYALREEYSNVATPLDALYYTVVTASTVGYGDISPTPESALARAFSMSLVIVGTAGFAVAAGSLLAPAIQAQVKNALGRMTQTELALLEDHVLVLGVGDLTEPILEELGDDSDVVVVTPTEATATALGERGYKTLVAEPSDEETLERVHLERARAVVVATDSDAEDALSVLTARQCNPGVRIVAAASERENVAKLRRAGADTVISPAVIGGRLLVRSALGEEGMEDLADRVLGEAGEDE